MTMDGWAGTGGGQRWVEGGWGEGGNWWTLSFFSSKNHLTFNSQATTPTRNNHALLLLMMIFPRAKVENNRYDEPGAEKIDDKNRRLRLHIRDTVPLTRHSYKENLGRLIIGKIWRPGTWSQPWCPQTRRAWKAHRGEPSGTRFGFRVTTRWPWCCIEPSGQLRRQCGQRCHQ